jgi:hypothetical protein
MIVNYSRQNGIKQSLKIKQSIAIKSLTIKLSNNNHLFQKKEKKKGTQNRWDNKSEQLDAIY